MFCGSACLYRFGQLVFGGILFTLQAKGSSLRGRYRSDVLPAVVGEDTEVLDSVLEFRAELPSVALFAAIWAVAGTCVAASAVDEEAHMDAVARKCVAGLLGAVVVDGLTGREAGDGEGAESQIQDMFSDGHCFVFF